MVSQLNISKECKCKICGQSSRFISAILGVCVNCIRSKHEKSKPVFLKIHRSIRHNYGLPDIPPKTPGGIECNICANECRIGDGEKGYCGLRWNKKKRLYNFSTPDKALLHAYKDPHVTNCCSSWFCPAGTGEGFPEYTFMRGAEIGYYNYAVFFYGCNFNCLFCQNSAHKNFREAEKVEISDFVKTVLSDSRISCLCYFGGSPEPQLPFALKAGREILENKKENRKMRVCFEWNGCGNTQLVDDAAELALKSGGNLKFDLKCFDSNLSLALSGVSNKKAYNNFLRVAEKYYERREKIPMLTATTLLVPGYIDRVEVERIAKFIATINPEIPYSLLIFHPDFYMYDLPVTPRKQMEECYKAASKFLKQVHIGNLELLGIENF